MSNTPPTSGQPAGKPILKPKSGSGGSGVDAKLTFEAALGQIEAIIERIEAGEVGLEESLAEYERGVGLINHCRGKLDRAKQRVEDLTRKLSSADEGGTSSGSQGVGKDPTDTGGKSNDDDAEPPF